MSLIACKIWNRSSNLSRRAKEPKKCRLKNRRDLKVLSTSNFIKLLKKRWCSNQSRKWQDCVKVKLCPRCPQISHTWVSRSQLEQTLIQLLKSQAYPAKEWHLETNILSFRKLLRITIPLKPAKSVRLRNLTPQRSGSKMANSRQVHRLEIHQNQINERYREAMQSRQTNA